MRTSGERRRHPFRTARGTLAAVAATGVIASALAAAAPAAPAAATPMPAILAAGGGHSCAVTPTHRVWCWGLNTSGQLGNGTLTDSMAPSRVNTLTGLVSIATGHDHTCAVNTSSQVWCWGSDAFGELGNGTTSAHHALPVLVQGIQASQVSAGYGSTCGVTLAKTVKCWGDNNYGELGDGSTNDASTPQKVNGLSNVVQVAVGDFHACAVESNGTVFCWGSNTFGALGNGTTTSSDVPVRVPIEAVTSLAAGADDTCAISTGGDLRCWGENSTGKLGVGNFNDQLLPAQVHGMTRGVYSVGLGEDFSCALTSDPAPTALCWGDANSHGQLGNGAFHEITPIPRPVFGVRISPTGAGPADPQQIAVGAHHACVVMISGLIECWGEGFFGDLGDGSALDRAIPTPVIGLPGASGTVDSVIGGLATSCAVTPDLEADCWGTMVGDGTPLLQVHTTPVQVLKLPASGVSEVTAAYGGCALVRLGGLSTGLRCWGDNTWGELGNGTTNDSTTAVVVQNLPNKIESVTSGAGVTCVLVDNGGARCWGRNSKGQVGDGTTTNRTTPVTVKGLPVKLAQIAAARDHVCALLLNGTVACWGGNDFGQLGDGTTNDSSTPVTVTNLTGVVQIAVGDSFSCALRASGAVECWGLNKFAELGNGTTADSHVPSQVSGLSSGVVAIAAGNTNSCAIVLAGQAVCWGYNSNGQLGDGSMGGQSSTPVSVSGFSSNGVSIGLDMGAASCAVNFSQQAECWGQNSDGELGDGNTADSDVPVPVQF